MKIVLHSDINKCNSIAKTRVPKGTSCVYFGNDFYRKEDELLLNRGLEFKLLNKLVEELSAEGLSKWITEEGFVGIIDSNGKKWNLQTYIDTVVQSRLTDADIEAGRVEGLQRGVDLAVISQHGAKDECAKWEGCIVSMNGMTEGFPLYADIKATNECFHPRCGHHLQPVRNIGLIHETTIKQSEKKMKENWQTLKQ